MDIIKKLSVVIDGQTISNKNSAETFVYSINYLSNKVGKEKLNNDFPKIFSKIDFQKKVEVLKSRDEKPNLEILIPRVRIFILVNPRRKKLEFSRQILVF
jgi:hypothetical protein